MSDDLLGARPHFREKAPFGAILAGGESSRFGSPKGLARVGGRTIAERVRDALALAGTEVVLIANDPNLYADLHLPTRPDRRPGQGPLAGVEAALYWAMEEGRPGVLVAACDMPFLNGLGVHALTGSDMAHAAAFSGTQGPPLCAYFSTGCIGAAMHLLDNGGDHSIRALLDAVRTTWMDDHIITRLYPHMFFNVNTPEDLARAEEIARGRGV